MKFQRFIIPILVGLTINQASAQASYTEETDPLNITTEDYSESYVNRTVGNGTSNAVTVNSGFSYTGKNVNIINNSNSFSNYGIYGFYIDFINITADDGTWSTIEVNADNGNGLFINISNPSAPASHMGNTKINRTGTGGTAILFGGASAVLEFDNVEINTTGSGTTAMNIIGGSTVTNRGMGQVTINSAGSNAIASMDSTIDFHNATINNSGATVFNASGTSTISLTNSTISSVVGAKLVSGSTSEGATSTVNLDNVNLDMAKGMLVQNSGSLVLNLSNGTNFDGYTATTGDITLNLSSGASWNVTQDSVLGTNGMLTLDGSSTISFAFDVSTESFANINAATIALESGAILMLGVDAATIEAIIEENGGEYSTNLFTSSNFSDKGVVLMTSDGQKLEYTRNDSGSYSLKSIIAASIPEPATATLGLVALGLLTLRRRMAV